MRAFITCIFHTETRTTGEFRRVNPMSEQSYWNRVLQGRLSRRRAMVATGSAAAAAAFLAACGGSDSGGGGSSSGGGGSTNNNAGSVDRTKKIDSTQGVRGGKLIWQGYG